MSSSFAREGGYFRFVISRPRPQISRKFHKISGSRQQFTSSHTWDSVISIGIHGLQAASEQRSPRRAWNQRRAPCVSARGAYKGVPCGGTNVGSADSGLRSVSSGPPIGLFRKISRAVRARQISEKNLRNSRQPLAHTWWFWGRGLLACAD